MGAPYTIGGVMMHPQIQQAQEEQCRGVARTVLGSVADKVVRSADVPVLVVRPAQKAAAAPQIGAVATGATP